MTSLKICFFIPFFPFTKGGAEYQSKLIALELLNLGHDVFFISQGLKNGQLIYEDGFKIYGVEVISNVEEKVTLYKDFSKTFKKIILVENPDIVYQRILNTFSYRISTITNKLDIPYVLHIADNYSIEFKGVKGIVKKQLFKNVVKNNVAIITQTNYQYSIIKELAQNNLIIKVPNMHPKILKEVITKQKNEILWIGNARPVKQLELYLELAKSYEGSNYLFKVIGNLPKTVYGQQLQKIIKESTNVKYFGEQENTFINKELSSVGLLINTSVSEGFSNTFIQAWMSGTPVLSLNSDPDGIIEQFDLGVNCNGDTSKLFIEMKTILDSEMYQETCINALKVSNELFSLQKNVKLIENLFKDITGAN